MCLALRQSMSLCAQRWPSIPCCLQVYLSPACRTRDNWSRAACEWPSFSILPESGNSRIPGIPGFREFPDSGTFRIPGNPGFREFSDSGNSHGVQHFCEFLLLGVVGGNSLVRVRVDFSWVSHSRLNRLTLGEKLCYSDLRMSRGPGIRIPCNPDTRKSGYVEIQISKYLDARISGSPDTWICGNADIRVSGYPDFRISGYPDFRISGYPDTRISGYPNIRISGNPGIRIPGYPDIRISAYPGIRIYGFPEIRISGYPGIRISGFPGIRISEYPDFRISGFPEIRMPAYLDFRIAGKYICLHFLCWPHKSKRSRILDNLDLATGRCQPWRREKIVLCPCYCVCSVWSAMNPASGYPDIRKWSH